MTCHFRVSHSIAYNGKILAKAGIRGTTAEFRTKV